MSTMIDAQDLTALRTWFVPWNANPGPIQAINLRACGAKCDGTTDDTAAWQAAITAAASTNNRVIYHPGGTSKITSTLQNNASGLHVLGNHDISGASVLLYTGTGPLWQQGTDNGHAYDAADYDGVQDLWFSNIGLRYGGASTTALSNGQGTYGTGTYGIRDWRGGGIRLRNVSLQNFEYGFWGIQSDINVFDECLIGSNKTGIYLGPRSDQNTLHRLYTLYNDTAVKLDRVTGTRFRDCQFVGDGAAATYPVVVGSAYSIGTRKTTFDACWFEHYQGAAVIPAYVGIGVGDSVQTFGIKFRDCTFWTATQGSAISAQYVADIGNADRVVIDDPEGDLNNLAKTVHFVGTSSAQVKIESTTQLSTTSLNSGSGTPTLTRWTWGNSAGVPTNKMNTATAAPSVADQDGSVKLVNLSGVYYLYAFVNSTWVRVQLT